MFFRSRHTYHRLQLKSITNALSQVSVPENSQSDGVSTPLTNKIDAPTINDLFLEWTLVRQ